MRGNMNGDQLKQQVNQMLESGKHDEIKEQLLAHKDVTEHDNDLAIICYLCTVHEQERAAGQRTIFEKVSDMEALIKRYTILKFYLRRIEFNVMDDMRIFEEFLVQNQISSYELLRVLDFSAVHKDKVLQRIGTGAAEKAVEDPVEMDVNVSAAKMDEKADSNSGIDTYRSDDTQQICFIICTNNPIYAEECIHYINHLIVPEGIDVEILTVEEAKSMTAGYNEAMHCSKAKYKVYLHHDTFIINPNFIKGCLDIFMNHPQIGMIGNIGVKTMPASGVMWEGVRYGMLYEQHIYETELLCNAVNLSLKYMQVDAIDGFLMVTQYDIPWREDLFDKWDFYDCSQSMEFIRHGYQVVVPSMREPWCVHDCGFVNLKDYDVEKEKFVAEYLS